MTNETELNVTDVKSLAAIKPFISALQTFIKKNICNGNTMTAGTIYEVFSKESKCNLDSESFVKGFRVAVRAGLITGIESAKRAGYKEAGTEIVRSANDDVLDDIQPYLEGIQVFIDKHIQGEIRMTAAVIYEKFSKTTKCELSEEDFVKSFRLAIREGKIKGLESAYKFGYKRISTAVEVDETEEDEEKTGHDICEIVIDERRKLVALDRLNWVLQVRRDTGSWANEAYIPNIESGIRCLARRLLDDEMKGMNRFSIIELANRIEEAEKRIQDLLVKVIPEKTKIEVKAA